MSMSSNGSFSGSEGASDSFRGLEKYFDRSGRAQRNMAWDAVLIEQDEQEQTGYYDDERIAKLYQKAQEEHDGQQKVLDRARSDRRAADQYLMTPRTLKLMKETINAKDIAFIDLMDSDIDADANEDANRDYNCSSFEDNNGVGNSEKAIPNFKIEDDNNDERSIAEESLGGSSQRSEGSRHSKFMRRLSV